MFKSLLLASTALVCLTLVGNNLVIARNDHIQADAQHSDATEHHHKTIEIPAGQPIPSVDLVVHQDPMKGWNLEIKVSNFRFAPENVSTQAKPGEGHAHLYVNGEKLTRLYGSWFYLDNLKPGKNTITVGLNANSHDALVHNGQMISDTEIIQVPASINHRNYRH